MYKSGEEGVWTEGNAGSLISANESWIASFNATFVELYGSISSDDHHPH